MAEAMVEKLNSLEPAFLVEIVRMDQNNPSFEVTEWSVKRLSDKGIRNPDGLWLFRGGGKDGKQSKSWSIVLKILERPEEEEAPDNMRYWKRELLLVQSGAMERLPGPVAVPRFYWTEETSEGAWLWQEYIESHRPDPWTLEDYAFVAHQLGYWNGACATSKPLGVEPWLARQHYRSWYTEANPERDLQYHLNQKYISGDLRRRYEQLWADRELFYQVWQILPQTFSHFDSQRRNLMIRKGSDNRDELVLIDWAMCGLGPLGAELYGLVGMSGALMEYAPALLAQFEAAAFPSYMRGLSESGWSGDAAMVRLGYLTWTIVWLGVVFPNFVTLWCTPDFRSFALQQLGCAEEELCRQWMPVWSYALDCTDEARFLINKLGLL